ncbi:MAG: hypothetical protein HQL76_14925 [Magnetococcales bacterium]|nr:hypothetical protein [Magnetococcales bacterium]
MNSDALSEERAILANGNQDGPMNHSVNAARQRAIRWYKEPDLYRHTVTYEKEYSTLPRLLFEEISLAQIHRDAPAILDVSPATWLEKHEINENFERLDTGGTIWETDFTKFSGTDKKYDLILVYSLLRLISNPGEFFIWLNDRLAPGGRCCLLDFVGGVAEELSAHILSRVSSEKHRCFLMDQLEAAPLVEDIQLWLKTSEISRYRLAVGGLGGFPERGAEAMTLISTNSRILPLLTRLSQSGFRSRRAADIVFHLTFTCGGGE